MKRFVEGVDREQGTLFPEQLEDYVADDNPVRVIDVFVDELDPFRPFATLPRWAAFGSETGHPIAAFA